MEAYGLKVATQAKLPLRTPTPKPVSVIWLRTQSSSLFITAGEAAHVLLESGWWHHLCLQRAMPFYRSSERTPPWEVFIGDLSWRIMTLQDFFSLLPIIDGSSISMEHLCATFSASPGLRTLCKLTTPPKESDKLTESPCGSQDPPGMFEWFVGGLRLESLEPGTGRHCHLLDVTQISFFHCN